MLTNNKISRMTEVFQLYCKYLRTVKTAENTSALFRCSCLTVMGMENKKVRLPEA